MSADSAKHMNKAVAQMARPSLYVLLCERIEDIQAAAKCADQPELPFGREPDDYDATILPQGDEIPY